MRVRVYWRKLRNYSYAYLELRRALKLRVFIGQSRARRDRYIAKNRALDTTRSARSLRSLATSTIVGDDPSNARQKITELRQNQKADNNNNSNGSHSIRAIDHAPR